VEEIGGLIVDLYKSAAAAREARKRGAPALPTSEILRRFFIGAPAPPGPPPGPKAQPPRPPAPAAPRAAAAAPVQPAAAPAPAPLLADFHEPRRFLAAFVLAEALGPPVALRKGDRPG
jgi:pyruvate/2-oxoglutarate dehydrogenase complex dihydrolipoamide acyltransferase (E2) component